MEKFNEGDIVYTIEENRIKTKKVKEVSYFKGFMLEDETTYRQSFELGVRVFKTKKEAKQILKYRQKKG